MQKVHIDVEGVTLNGEDQKVGAVIELGEGSAKALIREGKAHPVDAEGRPVGTQPETGTPANASGGPDDEAVAAAAEIERQKKALDDQYNLEEGGTKPGLKEAAQTSGVDFPYDVKKADLIELIVAQGKAAELIK